VLTTPYNVIGWPRRIRVDRSAYNPSWVDRWNTNLRAVATGHPNTVTIADLNHLLGPDGKWADVVNGVKVHTYDKMHLSPEGADLVAGWLAPQLVRLARAPVPSANASVGVPGSESPLRLRR
jgi:lysophospholipase L1-like esterase